MKKKDSTSDFTLHRAQVLREAFHKALAAQSRIEVAKAFKDAAEAPAPRLWISEPRAAAVLSKLLNGTPLPSKTLPNKREMYAELLHRAKEYLRLNPGASVTDAAFEAVNAPADSSYISPDRVKTIINSEKRRRRFSTEPTSDSKISRNDSNRNTR